MQTKRCTKCLVEKALEQFSRNARNKTDGRQPKCKDCHRAYEIRNAERIRVLQHAKYARDPARAKRRVSDWVKKNPEKALANKRAWRERNVEKMVQIRKQWLEDHPEYRAYNCRMYQASKLRATPAWANRTRMRRFYTEARRLTRETGIQHHVDHIVPLISKVVCGLHCEANLQVLRFDENVRKSNRFRPQTSYTPEYLTTP